MKNFKRLPIIFAGSFILNFILLLILEKSLGVSLSGKTLGLIFVFAFILAVAFLLIAFVVLSTLGKYLLDKENALAMKSYIDSMAQGDFSKEPENITSKSLREVILFKLKDLYFRLISLLSQTKQLTLDLGDLSRKIISQSEHLSQASLRQAESVERMVLNLEQIDEGIRQIFNSVDELKTLSQETSSASYQMMTNIQNVSEMAESLANLVRDLVTAISQIVANIQSVAQATDSLSSASAQTSSSMREIDQATQAIRTRADESAKIASSAKERAVRAGELIESWAQGMEKIEASVSQATNIMADLVEQSEAIGEIVSVINEIASETHLLSLNASIMAARAGEHGRGFMVVANEIKELARRTSESTKEIEALINRTRKAVKESQSAISQAYNRAKEGIQLSWEAQTAVTQVLEQMEKSARYAQEIAQATDEQAKLASQVYESSAEVDERTQLIKTAMREQEDSSAYLKERAEKMHELTEKVKIASKEQAENSQQVSRAVEELTASIEVIRGSTEDQSRASSEILNSVQQVKKASDLVALSAEDVKNTAISVLDESLILQSEMKGFKFPILQKQLKVGLLLDTLREERWRREKEIFIKRCERLGAQVLDAVADGDQENQNTQAQKLIEKGAQILVIVAVDAERAFRAVEFAHQKNIKVIAYDRLIKSAPLDLFITYNYREMGAQMVKYALRRRPEGKYFLLLGSRQDVNAVWLREGQHNALEPALRQGKVELIGESWTPNWEPERAYQIIKSILDEGKIPDVIIASNDGTAGGAIRALEEFGLAGKVLVTGMDAELDACRRIARGKQAITFYMPVHLQATRASEACLLMLYGEEIFGADQYIDNNGYKVPAILLNAILVDAENLREIIIASGTYAESEIYGD